MPTVCGSDHDSAQDGRVPGDGEATEAGASAGAVSGREPEPAREQPRVFGDYRILREIGRGGMGVVYEAWQASLARRVALKVLSQGLGDSRRRRRFEREARSAGRLHHTNIVPVFGFGEHEGIPYYVMQCIKGVGLDAALDDPRRAAARLASTEAAAESSAASDVTEGHAAAADPTAQVVPDPPELPLPRTDVDAGDGASVPPEPETVADPPPRHRPPEVLDDGPSRWKWVATLGVQAASGLDYAHSQGVLHRDVKPSNLLLDERGILWVTDFGLAKWGDHHDLTQSDDVVGTLRYMPPEAFDGVYGPAGDVYGLGLTLYELLARRPAFDESDRGRLIRQVSQASPPRLRKLDRRIPLDLATVVHKAIERRPEDRYASAAELGADLARFLEDRPVLARRASPAECYWRWARRNPAIAVLGAILTAVLVLATVGSLAAAGRFREQAEAQRLLADAARRARDEEAGARRLAQRALRDLEASRAEEDRTLYDTRASLAGAAWAADDYGQYRSFLDLMRPAPGAVDRRGWEWRHLLALNSEALREVGSPGDSFVAVAMHPDGSSFATLAPTGTMRVWGTSDGRELLTIRAPNADGRNSNLHIGVLALAYSPDGRRLAGAGGDGAIGVYDAATGERLRRLEEGEVSVLSLAWSPDGSRLAAGLAGHAVRVWDVEGGRLEPGPPDRLGGPAAAVAVSPDGRTLAAATFDGAVWLWTFDAEPRRLHVLRGHEGEARALAFSPDGSRLASAGLDGTVRIWGVAAGTAEGVLAAHKGGALCLAWPREGGWLASGGNDNSVRIWDPAAGRPLHKFLGHSEGVRALAAGRDGRALVSASPEGVAKVWDAGSSPRPRTFEAPATVAYGGAAGCVAISRDGRLVASGHFDGIAQIWDAATGALLHRLRAADSGVRALAFSPDGRRLAASAGEPRPARGEVVVWDLADGRPVATYRSHGEVVDAVAFLDDRRIASAGGDRKVHVWDPATAERLMILEGHAEGVRRLALSGDGRTLASGSDDGTVRLWDAATGRPGPVFAAAADVLALAFSEDGRWLASAVRGGSILLWDPSRPGDPRRLDGHARDVLALVFSPDGRLISGGLDKCVRVWDVEGGRAILTLRDHGAAVTGVAISRDGGRLASSSFDHTVKVWEAPPAAPDQPANAK